MSVKVKQPSIRFDKGGPYAWTGVSFLPKIVTFKKTGIAGTENDDFFVMPAGAYIAHAFMRCDTVVDNAGVVTLGTDGNPDALIDATDFSGATVGNSATNIGSATAEGKTGLYLHAGDTIRLATTGTATVGAVSGFLVYYELGSMLDQITHFEM